ncbi:hypothetical protein TWF102_011107 [Orbilia oligospora]|uniref:F-box domain-containing protein n=1 Tax=Orbilia oligospora TaxID=2813651 RepID=A0A7C8J533_ORBOL|nr:hypothetical protein TWF102_011107 [Orbilia oligospora]KAF3094233.1 hypothetical protein TWF103_010628 [Orbilia oligospora]KAF3153149.1 hypothetical protein TWF594_000186 [Orbilia oligospora]
MDRLPLEILRQITSYLPYNSLFSLSYVSHKIRVAIQDWQIYKAIIDVPNHGSLRQPPGRYELDNLRVKWTRNPITAGMSPEACELYAKADYKCWTILAEEYKLMSRSFTRDFVQYGGIMAARAHPFTQLNLHRPVHLHNLGKLGGFHDLPVAHRYIFSFWITTYLLSFSVPAQAISRQEDEEDSVFVQNFEEGQRTVHESCTDLVHALDLESALYIDTMDQPAQDGAPQEREVIAAFHFRNYVSEDGAWMGFNGYGLPRHLDLGIIGVKFTVGGEGVRINGIDQMMDGTTSGFDYHDDYEPWLQEHQTNVRFLTLQGTANHREGKVHLRGRVFPASGRVMLAITYANGGILYWAAFMTPFGIFGRWRSDMGHRDGYLWLWKEAWCDDSRADRS